MPCNFNEDKLYELQRDFYNLTKIKTVIFSDDFSKFYTYPKGIIDFCKVVRSCSEGSDRCLACDLKACDYVSRERKPFIYSCHAGLTEAMTPLIIGDVLTGYLFLGHIFDYPDHETGWEKIREACADLPIDMRLLHEAAMKLPITPQEYVESATHIMLAVANYLATERLAVLRENTLDVQLDGYISKHFTEKIDVDTLCKTFGISRTKLYELSSRLYGCGIAGHIRDLRIGMAKELMMKDKKMKLSDIFSKCGFSDYNYFINVFTKAEGCSPGEWRKKNR